MLLLPQRCAHLARIYLGRCARLERLEVECHPCIVGDGRKLAPLLEVNYALAAADSAYKVVLMPAREDHNLLRGVVHTRTDNRGVPLAAVLADDGGVRLHSIFVEVVEDKTVHAVARKAALTTHRD